MVDPGSPSPHRLIEGTVALSRLPSSVPVVVVPDHLLTSTAGPVPVEIKYDGRGTTAWAWAERAWRDAEVASGTVQPVRPEDPPTFWLSRLAIERLGLGAGLDTTVSLVIPEQDPLTPVLPLVHDIPENGEVQVSRDAAAVPRSQIMVRNGVAAWVTLVPRDHVRPGTVRISNHLRAVTGPVSVTAAGSDAVFFRPVAGEPGRTGRARTIAAVRAGIRSAAEGCLRWFFLAPEQSMRVAPAHPDDEHQHFATLQDVALSRLGVRSGDKVILRWGTAEVEVAAVADHDPGVARPTAGPSDPTKPLPAHDMPPHLAIRVPTALRHMTDLPAAAVVTVRRSTRSVLARNLNSLVIPVASLALAGAALNDPNWALLACGAVATAALGLSRLRMGNSRARRLRD
ncbi:hypothetical protein [Promicromonospora panici]|uniref:hypothetical protein n=1 Tax=Promicromonospora panici TaxID=2219658 RepID=UPI0013EC1F99|nr:hypothetical protein [Promicromonospora panici]